MAPTDVLTTDLYSSSTSANTGYNYDNNSDGASCSSFISKPNDSFTSFQQEEMEVDNHETGLDLVFTSASQSTIRYSSNSTMKDDLDDSAETTVLDTLITDTKLLKKQKRRAKKQEERKKAWLQNSTLNTHDKDEMS